MPRAVCPAQSPRPEKFASLPRRAAFNVKGYYSVILLFRQKSGSRRKLQIWRAVVVRGCVRRRFLRAVRRVAVFAAVRAGVVCADVYARRAAAARALVFVFCPEDGAARELFDQRGVYAACVVKSRTVRGLYPRRSFRASCRAPAPSARARGRARAFPLRWAHGSQ